MTDNVEKALKDFKTKAKGKNFDDDELGMLIFRLSQKLSGEETNDFGDLAVEWYLANK